MSAATTDEHQPADTGTSAEIARLREALKVPDESKRAVAYGALRGIYATSKNPRLRREAGEALGYSSLRLWLGDLLDRSAAPLL
jgi:hypothetical protein